VGLLSTCKQDLISIEVQAADAYNEILGYVNVNPLDAKKQKLHIPEATFEVRQPKALLGGMASVSLKVNVSKGKLFIIKETAQSFDASNTITADRSELYIFVSLVGQYLPQRSFCPFLAPFVVVRHYFIVLHGHLPTRFL